MKALLAIVIGAIAIATAFFSIYMIGWFVAKYIIRVGGRIDGEVAFVAGFLTVFLGTVVTGFLYALGSAILGTVQ